MLHSIARTLFRYPAVRRQAALLQIAGRGLATQKPLEEGGDDAAAAAAEHFAADTEDFVASEGDVDARTRYNFDENHIEVTGIVRGPPRVYTMPTGRQYAIVKLSTTSADRRGITRFVSFVDVFTPNSAVDYIKENIREGVQVYVSGQLRSRMRTDEDGRPFQDIRIQANGLFKIVAPRNLPEESNIAVEKRDSVTSESKQQDASQETSAKTASSE